MPTISFAHARRRLARAMDAAARGPVVVARRRGRSVVLVTPEAYAARLEAAGKPVPAEVSALFADGERAGRD